MNGLNASDRRSLSSRNNGFFALVPRELINQCRKREKVDQESQLLLASLQTEVEELRQETKKKEDELVGLRRARSAANDEVKKANDVIAHLRSESAGLKKQAETLGKEVESLCVLTNHRRIRFSANTRNCPSLPEKLNPCRSSTDTQRSCWIRGPPSFKILRRS